MSYPWSEYGNSRQYFDNTFKPEKKKENFDNIPAQTQSQTQSQPQTVQFHQQPMQSDIFLGFFLFLFYFIFYFMVLFYLGRAVHLLEIISRNR
jgi:hypothetical protein